MKTVIEGRKTSGFGMRVHPVTKKETGHNGIDIAAPIGTPVYSPIAGTVVSINTHATGGRQLIVEGRGIAPDGRPATLRAGFAHLSEWLVKLGQPINRGQLVAKSGNTGASTGPHLHYTYAIDGVKIDPTPFVNIG